MSLEVRNTDILLSVWVMHLLEYCSTQEVDLSNDVSFYAFFFSRSLNLEQENREKDKDKQYAATTDGENSKCTCGWERLSNSGSPHSNVIN